MQDSGWEALAMILILGSVVGMVATSLLGPGLVINILILVLSVSGLYAGHHSGRASNMAYVCLISAIVFALVRIFG